MSEPSRRGFAHYETFFPNCPAAEPHEKFASPEGGRTPARDQEPRAAAWRFDERLDGPGPPRARRPGMDGARLPDWHPRDAHDGRAAAYQPGETNASLVASEARSTIGTEEMSVRGFSSARVDLLRILPHEPRRHPGSADRKRPARPAELALRVLDPAPFARATGQRDQQRTKEKTP